MAAPRQCTHPERRDGRCVLCHCAYQRRYWHAHHPRPAKSRRKRARQVRRYIANGAGWYLRKLLSQGTRIPPSAWTPEQITLKLALLKLRRSIRLIPHSALRTPHL